MEDFLEGGRRALSVPPDELTVGDCVEDIGEETADLSCFAAKTAGKKGVVCENWYD